MNNLLLNEDFRENFYACMYGKAFSLFVFRNTMTAQKIVDLA